MNTALLDQVTWDYTLDANGDLAIASDPYSIAQDVASAIRAWAGEVYYDTTLGVNYPAILGKQPPLGYVKAQFLGQANLVPEVAQSVCYLEALSRRGLGGQVQVTTAGGVNLTVGFG